MSSRGFSVAALAVVLLTGLSLAGFALIGASSSQLNLQVSSCQPSASRGTVVQVSLNDSGAIMMGSAPIAASVSASPDSVSQGVVTFVATNVGTLNHELVILPLPTDGAGTRPVGADGKIDESQSLGEASTSCGNGPGDGISPGARSWTTVSLAPGRYELVCDLAWHYASGMFTTFTVT